LVSRRSLPGMLHTWARAGSHRFPGDPSYASALLQDPGRAGKISPWRSCRCCPRATQTEGLNGYIISRLTQGFSIRCLRFTSDVAATHARLASGWRATPLPGGGRTLWIASKGFRLHPILLSRTSPVARVVYAKPPFAGPEAVLAYLGRYTHRVAIANSRLIQLKDGDVDFTWKDYRDSGKTKVMTLSADEFIRRFLLHTVPDGFHRIRHIGFLANGHRTGKLAICRTLLAAPTPEPPAAESYRERVRRLTGHALDTCPDCGGAMQERGPLPHRPPQHRPFWCDTS
jgi:Putative transposase